jgi:hypothetical protein
MDEWPRTQSEYAIAHFMMLATLLLLSSFTDVVANFVQRRLEPDDHHKRRADFRRQLGLIVWSRLRGELMVAGFTFVWIWMASQAGLLDWIAAFSAARQAHRDVWLSPATSRPNPFWHPINFLYWMLSCHPLLPSDGETLLRLAQDVVVALYVTKLAYFSFLWGMLNQLLRWLSAYERLETGGPPVSSSETLLCRQLDAMREQLLSAVRSEPFVQSQLERSAELRSSVDSGTLYVSGFLAETMHAHVELLADFSPYTWMLLELYACLTASMMGFMCFEWRTVAIGLDVLWYASSLYLCYRLSLHASELRQTARQLSAERQRTRRPNGPLSARSGWPAIWVDWLLFPIVGPGATGFLPGSRKPSELVGLRCTQAMLWGHLYRLCEFATDPFNRGPPSAVLPGACIWVVPKLLCLALWCVWILPGMLGVFSLPPFLDELEHSLLLHTLRTYPNGLPAHATGGVTVAGDLGDARAPFHHGPLSAGPLSYVVMKAKMSEESWWPSASGVRSSWRWLLGLAPLRTPGQRLADHYEWIHHGGDTSTDSDVPIPTGARGGGRTAEPRTDPGPVRSRGFVFGGRGRSTSRDPPAPGNAAHRGGNDGAAVGLL